MRQHALHQAQSMYLKSNALVRYLRIDIYYLLYVLYVSGRSFFHFCALFFVSFWALTLFPLSFFVEILEIFSRPIPFERAVEFCFRAPACPHTEPPLFFLTESLRSRWVPSNLALVRGFL